ncbi:hypothetical protein DSL72_002266 [Monilinia vaccinii-corymbosi]|uniref:LicD/FKTN/FKRP nucleotidyltransferase domain-containing protein n=1 Tax=Monilinia vaccinii-corymbosi TaxID=61207 RepID=A0A8A3PC57_9HELO|nr:hypothetical protein DSL72_002266 [Monilinia vaccinii-corymbosi]
MRSPSFMGAIATTFILLNSFAHASRRPNEKPAAPPLRARDERVSTKYFFEPGGNYALEHYDIRYFRGHAVTEEEKQETLRHLVRSYLITFRERNIETWIAHGTLLGWWWNGKALPWDWDLDTQVSSTTLAWLAENLNMTTHRYTGQAEDGSPFVREYLLDVNPWSWERVRGDGMNVIDARWIDKTNGLFIDITGLAEVNPSAHPGIWSCKNYHRYHTRELYPLRETEFEGVPALVPYSFDKVLMDEYGPRALTKTLYMGHRWNPGKKEWIPEKPILIHEVDQKQKAQGQPQAQEQAQRQAQPGAQAQAQALDQAKTQEPKQGQPQTQEQKQDHPHMPRSIQSNAQPKAGLWNLLHVL